MSECPDLPGKRRGNALENAFTTDASVVSFLWVLGRHVPGTGGGSSPSAGGAASAVASARRGGAPRAATFAEDTTSPSPPAKEEPRGAPSAESRRAAAAAVLSAAAPPARPVPKSAARTASPPLYQYRIYRTDCGSA